MGLIHLTDSDIEEAIEISKMLKGEIKVDRERMEKFVKKYVREESCQFEGLLMFYLGIATGDPENKKILGFLGVLDQRAYDKTHKKEKEAKLEHLKKIRARRARTRGKSQ